MLTEKLRKEPDIFLRLAQSSLKVAKSLRQVYLDVTVKLAEQIRNMLLSESNDTGLTIRQVERVSGDSRLTVCFIDGGVGEAEIFFRVPLIVRGGIFRVKEGERDLERRETFEFFPVLIGDLDGGEKSRPDYASVVRIIVELAAVWHVLKDSDNKYSDVNLIMLHGPLLYRLSAYTNHWFYESDIERMTHGAEEIIQGYKEFCKKDPTPRDWFRIWEQQRKVRANHMIAYLLSSIIQQCSERGIHFIGVVERASATEICRQLFKKMLEDDIPIDDRLLPNPSGQYIKDADEIIERGNYSDPLLFSLVLEPGEYLSLWKAKERYTGFSGDLSGFGEWLQEIIPVAYTYLKPVENALALRVEFPLNMVQGGEVEKVMAKVYQYARLLPNYAFPVGLDIVDKFARVPKWMVEAYRKYIMFNFGQLAQEGRIDQTELERMLLFYHLHQRSFFNRPKV